MKTPHTLALLALVFGLTLLSGCNKEPKLKNLTPALPDEPYDYVSSQKSIERSIGFLTGSANVVNTPANNAVTNHGATLGRVLFYDPRLSINNTISCGSCHKQSASFADDKAHSVGFEGKITSRNTPPIINAPLKASFFWDGRQTSLESQTLMPVQNHIEMGLEQMDVLEKKLASVSYYPGLFEKAFGTREITADKISKALAQFTRSIATVNDRGSSNALNAQEKNGSQLFQKFRCASCHVGSDFGGAPLNLPYYGSTSFGINHIANIGLETHYTDGGVESITNISDLNGYFITPSLKNIALTGPYMHDGRFKTLEEVVEHYNSGIQPHPNLDPILQQRNWVTTTEPVVTVDANQPVRMHMTAQEKKDLVAFLKALTDLGPVNDKKYSNPF